VAPGLERLVAVLRPAGLDVDEQVGDVVGGADVAQRAAEELGPAPALVVDRRAIVTSSCK
jgi:hypothetical protein